MTETAQDWLERMADTWLTNPEITPTFPPGLVIRETGWRIMLDPAPLTAATMYERIEMGDVEFYATLADGREVTTVRPRAATKRAAESSWQRRERACCCGCRDQADHDERVRLNAEYERYAYGQPGIRL